MSIFKRIFSSYISHKKVSIRNSLIASAALFSINTNGAFAASKNYVAVEPLTCDIVKSIALPSDEVICLVDRKQDVHDLKISPKQARLLKKADKVFTLGTEMTPAMRNWVKRNSTVVLGVIFKSCTSCFLSTRQVTSSEGSAIDLTISQVRGSTAT